MSKLLLILALITGNAEAFWGDSITVNDDLLKKQVNISIDKYTRSSPGPTIILAHACGGVGSTDIVWARRIREWGYNVVIPDSLNGRGVNNICASGSVSPYQRNYDMVNVASWIKQQSWHKGDIGLIGFSNGGRAGLNISTNPYSEDIKAIVAYYPLCRENAGQSPKIPLQIHVGTLDDWTPSYACEQFGKETNASVYIYNGAYHGFDNPGPRRTYLGHELGYDASADSLAQSRTKNFFKENIR